VTNGTEPETVPGPRPAREWEPPVGPLGGPAALELYHELVAHAGMRLLRDDEGRPWIEMKDGEQRRRISVPSAEMRGAIDRFRLRRGVRPLPAPDLEEFVRVVEARITDPDAVIPTIDPPEDAPGPEEDAVATDPPSPEARSEPASAVERLDRLMREVDEIQGRHPAEDAEGRASPPWWSEFGHPVPLHSRLPHRWQASVSGGRREAPSADGDLTRYLGALRELVRDGTWIGPIQEIGRRTGDDPETVFASLLRYHIDLVSRGLVVAPVELEEGWQWVVVDREQIAGDRPLRPANAPVPAAPRVRP